jgi:hypothetical protein
VTDCAEAKRKAMAGNFNPTEWITTKEAAELTGYHVLCLAGVPVAVLDKGNEEGCRETYS